MAFVLDATVGGVSANSYLTVAEYLAYLETAYEPAESASALEDAPTLGMATRVLNAIFAPRRRLVRPGRGEKPYYLTAPTWTGLPATATQALPWPRTGMYDLNGNAISSNVIPQALKNATAELARQLKVADRTLDNDVSVQGITSVRAGSVAVSFKEMIDAKVLPDAVFDLLVPSWLTDEIITQAWPAEFDVIS